MLGPDLRGSHLQRPQTGKSQHMKGWGQNRVHRANPSELNLWELKTTACAVSSLRHGLPRDSPCLPVTGLAAVTTSGACICSWHCPCDRTLKTCVFVCVCECTCVSTVSVCISAHPRPHSSSSEEPALLPGSASVCLPT